MAVVSSCREMFGSVRKRAKPLQVFQRYMKTWTARETREEGGDDVKSSWPLWNGLQPCYNDKDNMMQTRKSEQDHKPYHSSD